MTDEPKLKACPFCDQSASIVQCGDRRQSTIYRCDGCGCSLETGEEWGHGAAWNRRAPALDTLPVSQDGQGPIRAMSATDTVKPVSPPPNEAAAEVEQDACALAAAAASRGLGTLRTALGLPPVSPANAPVEGLDLVLVPQEPTQEMFAAGWKRANEVAPNSLGIVTDTACGEIYRAMIAAARASRPTPEAEAEVEAVARELRRFRMVRCIDHWRLFRDGERIDGPWPDTEVELAQQALEYAQARAILALQPTREPTIGEEGQGSSVAGVPCAQTHTPTPSPAGWRPIKTAPKDGTKFDAWVPDAFGGHRVTDLSFNRRGQLRKYGLLVAAEMPRWPTHWMPSPSAPTSDSEASADIAVSEDDTPAHQSTGKEG